ncbi:glycosyltransferase family 4 protein, partial [Myxococcota bacterium]|nr:glycosyltransferase family 4 protein [Myxococcota bacterium]
MNPSILMILTEFPPAIGGMQTHANLLSRHLHAGGARVCVFTYRPESPGKDAAEVDSSFPFPIHRTLSRISYFYNLTHLREAVERFQPDFIYSSTVFFGVLERLTGIPTICRSVGNDVLRPWIAWPFSLGSSLTAHLFFEKKLYQFFKRLEKPEWVEVFFRDRRRSLVRTAATCAGTILANSHFTRRLLLEIGVPPEKIRVVVGGVDARFFTRPEHLHVEHLRQELGLPAGRTLFLTACRLVDKKGLDFLLEWFASQDPAARGWHMAVVGKGKRLGRLRALARRLEIQDHVTFVGGVAYESMPPYYWSSDVFILASTVYRDPITGVRDAETMGRVLCEANAAGLPVIASASGGIPSVISDGVNGLLFPENDGDRLSNSISRVLDDTDLRVRLVDGGLARARIHFDWAHILQVHRNA